MDRYSRSEEMLNNQRNEEAEFAVQAEIARQNPSIVPAVYLGRFGNDHRFQTPFGERIGQLTTNNLAVGRTVDLDLSQKVAIATPPPPGPRNVPQPERRVFPVAGGFIWFAFEYIDTRISPLYVHPNQLSLQNNNWEETQTTGADVERTIEMWQTALPPDFSGSADASMPAREERTPPFDNGNPLTAKLLGTLPDPALVRENCRVASVVPGSEFITSFLGWPTEWLFECNASYIYDDITVPQIVDYPADEFRIQAYFPTGSGTATLKLYVEQSQYQDTSITYPLAFNSLTYFIEGDEANATVLPMLALPLPPINTYYYYASPFFITIESGQSIIFRFKNRNDLKTSASGIRNGGNAFNIYCEEITMPDGTVLREDFYEP